MPQRELYFVERYDADMAAWDTILYQIQNNKLQQKITADAYANAITVKYELSLEQGKRKVHDIDTDRTWADGDRVTQPE